MSSIDLGKYLLERNTFFSFFILIPLLILSTFLEVLGISLVPILIGLILDPSSVLEFGSNSNYKIISKFSNYLNSFEHKKIIIFFFTCILHYFFN